MPCPRLSRCVRTLLSRTQAPHLSVVSRLFDQVREKSPTPVTEALKYPDYTAGPDDPFKDFGVNRLTRIQTMTNSAISH
jgi:hypothetical protein